MFEAVKDAYMLAYTAVGQLSKISTDHVNHRI